MSKHTRGQAPPWASHSAAVMYTMPSGHASERRESSENQDCILDMNTFIEWCAWFKKLKYGWILNKSTQSFAHICPWPCGSWIIRKHDTVPKQGWELQSLVCMWGPGQLLPSCCGEGELQNRSLVWTPESHSDEHWDHTDHTDQPPFTGSKQI